MPNYTDPITKKVGDIGAQSADVVASDTIAAQNRAQRIANAKQSAATNIVNLGTVSPNTTQTTQPQGQSAFEFITGGNDEYDKLVNKNYADTQGLVTDQNQIRQNYINQFSDRINALNQVYDQQLAQARQQGMNRVGQGTAILARRGIAGSPRAGAIQDNIITQNNEVEAAIQAQRNAEIGAIYGLASQMAVEEARFRTEQKQKGVESYLSELKTRDQRKQEMVGKNVAAMIASGIDINTVDVDELARTLGVSRQEIISNYQTAKSEAESAAAEAKMKALEANAKLLKTEADIKKIEADIAKGKVVTLGEGSILYNTETGEYFKNPKTYKGGGGGSDDLTEEDFYNDIASAQDDLRDGASWGEVWNVLKAKYNAPDDVLDQMLNKEMWFEGGAYERQQANR